MTRVLFNQKAGSGFTSAVSPGPEMSVSLEEEQWAIAARLLELHGAAIGDFIEERVAQLTDQGDEEGIVFWRDITNKLLLLIGPAEGVGPQ